MRRVRRCTATGINVSTAELLLLVNENYECQRATTTDNFKCNSSTATGGLDLFIIFCRNNGNKNVLRVTAKEERKREKNR